MSLNAWAKGRVLAFDATARPWALRGRVRGWAYDFLLFGLKQAWACLFGGAMVALLVATHLWWPAHAALSRYDLLVAAALGLQVFLLATRLERWDEAPVILVFHVVGTAMEVFKTAQGSWIYPEASVLRIGGVPACRSSWASCWSPSSSGSPRTSAPSPPPGPIRSRTATGGRSPSGSSGPGFC